MSIGNIMKNVNKKCKKVWVILYKFESCIVHHKM